MLAFLGLSGQHQFPGADHHGAVPASLSLASQERMLLQSTSLHSLEQVEAGKEQYGALDYAFLSPIFDSVSKKVRFTGEKQ